MKFDREVKQDLVFIGAGCGICSVLTALAAILIGEFTIPVLLGCLAGGLLAFGNFFFMTVGVIMALETGDPVAAKKKMRSSRTARTVVQLGVIALTLIFPQYVHWLPVILATFFPRILIGVRGYWQFFRHRNDPVPVSENPAAYDDEPEETDGFEKFVSHFATKSIPDTQNEDDKK